MADCQYCQYVSLFLFFILIHQWEFHPQEAHPLSSCAFSWVPRLHRMIPKIVRGKLHLPPFWHLAQILETQNLSQWQVRGAKLLPFLPGWGVRSKTMTDKGHLAHNDLPAEVLTCRTHPWGWEKKGRKEDKKKKDKHSWHPTKERAGDGEKTEGKCRISTLTKPNVNLWLVFP